MRESFEHHNEAINALKPETWDRARLRDELGQALTLIDEATDVDDAEHERLLDLAAAEGIEPTFGE